MQKMKLEYISTEKIGEYDKNARTHSDTQVEQIAASIKEFGFNNPILIDEAQTIIAGHGRLMAARLLGLDKVPCIRLSHLSERQRRAYILADNKIAMNAGWDFEKLADELSFLVESEFDVNLTGFAEDELDALLKADADLLPPTFTEPETITVSEHERKVPAENVGTGLKGDDETPEVEQDKTTNKPGDVWLLGGHRLVCGDSLNPEDITILMVGKKADMVFTDPPYNVPASMISKTEKHGEFSMASGEMSEGEFVEFLSKVFTNLKANTKDGSIHYVCMDWRHMKEIIVAGNIYAEGNDNAGTIQAGSGMEQRPDGNGNFLPE